jgi:hypothetical protein
MGWLASKEQGDGSHTAGMAGTDTKWHDTEY